MDAWIGLVAALIGLLSYVFGWGAEPLCLGWFLGTSARDVTDQMRALWRPMDGRNERR